MLHWFSVSTVTPFGYNEVVGHFPVYNTYFVSVQSDSAFVVKIFWFSTLHFIHFHTERN